MKTLSTSAIATSLAVALLNACASSEPAADTATAPAAAAQAETISAPAPALPAGVDMARLTSEAKEPPGPGTPLGPYTDIAILPAPGLNTHTLYYPRGASTTKEKLPVLVWGNGACMNDGQRFSKTLTKIASHGYVVIAVGLFEPESGAPRTTGQQMIEAIDWITASPALPDDISGAVDVSRIAVMGQSCGGLMTLEAAGDPRVDSIGVINSGVYPAGAPGLSNVVVSKDDLAKVHTPALYINGGPTDIAFENSNDDFERLADVPVFYGAMKDAGHFATHRHKNGGRFAEVMTAWLDWTLKKNDSAGKWFSGADCGLCQDPDWTVRRKNIEG